MGSRSLGELLLHPASLSRISLAQNFRTAAPSWTTCRMISNSSASKAAQPQLRGEESSQAPAQPASNAPSQKQSPAGAAQTSQAIDSLLGDIPSYTPRGRSAYGSQSSGRSAASMGAKVFGERFAGTRQTFQFRRAGLDIDSMTGLSMPSQEKKAAAAIPPEEQVYPRLNPTYGRTVTLDEERGRDLVRGIGMLNTLMARNKVRADFNKQKFHERGGLRRKRLKSERWRARFKRGFKDVTSRVGELTRKGW